MMQTAQEAYAARLTAARALLDRIASYLDDSANIAPEAVTWSHVGDLGHICELLGETVKFAYNEEA